MPPDAEPPGAQETEPYDVDVIQLSDFRLPGGTTSSIAEEVRAQSEAGITTALIHAAGSITNYPNPWSTHIRRILDLPHVRIASPRSRLHAKVLVIRHPTVIYSTRSTFDHISADHIIIVVNHAAVDAAGTWHYPVEATDARVRRLFGQAPHWAPIGPVVRGTVLDQTTRIPLEELDWVNIFRAPGQLRRRTGFIADKPVIGRHSRPQPGKWPDTGRDILQAYPETPGYQVEILGGAKVAENKLGYVPTAWNVIPFGGEEPNHFLERIDFWVYMHHPDLKEAFGRAAMEALAAGCVAIMPPYLEELFGEAALYATPREVLGIVDRYRADPEMFLEQSARAQDFARSFSPRMHLDRLAELGAHPPDRDRPEIVLRPPQTPGITLVIGVDPEAGVSTSAAVEALDRADRQRLGQDGQQPGPHRAAVMAVQITDDPQSSSSGPGVQLLGSAAALNTSEQAWQDYLCRQVLRMLSTHRPAQIVVMGDHVPQGLLSAFTRADVHRTWLRSPGASGSATPDPAVAARFQSVLTSGDP